MRTLPLNSVMVVVLFSLSCVKPKVKNMGGEIRVRGTPIGVTMESTPSQPTTEENNSRNVIPPIVVIPDKELDPDAQPPVVVSGSFLHCSPSVSPNVLACDFRAKDGRSVTGPSKIQWTGRAADGSDVAVKIIGRDEDAEGHCIYFVEIPSSDVELIAVNLEQPASAQYSYKTTAPDAGDGKIAFRTAMRLTALPSENENQIIPFGPNRWPIAGDGNVNPDGLEDPCYESYRKSGSGFGATLEENILFSNAIEHGTLYIKDICSLSRRGVQVTVTGPPGFGVQYFELLSVPQTGHLVLAKDIKFPAGSYRIRIQSQPSGFGMEDFGFDNVYISVATGKTKIYPNLVP